MRGFESRRRAVLVLLAGAVAMNGRPDADLKSSRY
jgi:hypothetical protein